MSLKNILMGGGAVVALAIVGFLLLQLLPVSPPSNPPVAAEPPRDSPQTRALAKRACFDCHSNEAVFPWYAYVAPVKWLVVRDVNAGRRALNFSDWRSGGRTNGSRVARSISEGEMPMAIYLVMHPSARLTAAEQQQLIDGLMATLK
jgi:hypothetical protein